MQIFQITPEIFIEDYFVIERPLDQLEFDSEYSPFDYLKFAKEDLETGNEKRSIINAIGNAKRALHLQVETICSGYGYKSKSKDFPPKLIFLKELGVAAPKIIEKLNKTRNRIEHDYYLPTLDEANDFLDIVELFLYATISFIVVFPDETTLILADDSALREEYSDEELSFEHIVVRLEQNTGILSIEDSSMHVGQDKKLLLSVHVGQIEYFVWIRKLFTHLFYLPL